jgi:hypothetical protein
LRNNQRKPLDSVYTTAINHKNKTSNESNDFNIDSIMAEMIFRPLVNRLIEMKHEIKNDENLVNLSKLF